MREKEAVVSELESRIQLYGEASHRQETLMRCDPDSPRAGKPSSIIHRQKALWATTRVYRAHMVKASRLLASASFQWKEKETFP
jgi:hypothetical protein